MNHSTELKIYSDVANQDSAPFSLPDLPYSKDNFKPHFTPETFDFHHGKHHQTYVNNLNNLLQKNEELADKSLEEIILATANNHSLSNIFNNAAQVWNHSFFWHSIKPNGGGKPNGILLEQINKDFGSYENFIIKFKEAAVGQFGSGWVWLVWNNSKVEIIKSSNADTPITQNMQPLLACDVWEHAYYIDYRNKRPDYIEVYLDNMINWQFVAANFNR